MLFEHCCSLSFKGKPNYDYFCHLFDDLLVKEGLQSDMTFDWDVADAEILGQGLKAASDFPLHECNPPYKRHLQ